MKIAVIGVKGLPANQGGIEHYCQALYPKMVERGHSVDLYARSSYIKKPWFSVYKFQGVRIICLPSLSIRGLDALTNSGLATFVSLFNNYDIVHFHALGPSLFSIIPRLFSSAKVIATCQGLDWQRGKWGRVSSQIIHLGEKAAAKYSHRMIVVSKALDNYFQKTYGIEPIYIPNGPGIYADSDVNFSFVKSLELTPKKYFLFLGRLVPEKRPDLLVKAFAQANTKGWKLVLAGGDSDTTEYINKLHQLANKHPDIIFAGELKGRFLAEMVRGAGLFVLPSDLEGLPLAMLEAMREGVPALASDIEPHQQLIGSDRGLLFEAGNTDSCAAALQEIVLDEYGLLSVAKNAQNHVKSHYNWDKITSENLAVYDSSLSTPSFEQKSPSKQVLSGEQ